MALVEENCRTDYLTIEGSSSICRLNRLTNRYCGEFLADENKVESNLQICGEFAKTIQDYKRLLKIDFLQIVLRHLS